MIHKTICGLMLAVALVSCVAVAVSGDASADSSDPTCDQAVDRGIEAALAIGASMYYGEPSPLATKITGEYSVRTSIRSPVDIVIGDGAVISVSNSARIVAPSIFLEGTVKLVSADGSTVTIRADRLYCSNMNLAQDAVITTDGSFSIQSDSSSTGFFDPKTSSFDPSKGMRASAHAKVDVTSGTATFGSEGREVRLSQGPSALEVSASIDLTQTYNSIMDKMRGAPYVELWSRLLDYVQNNLVYPSVDVSVSVAKGEIDGVSVEGAKASLVSGPAKRNVTLHVGVDAMTGAVECKGLSADVSFSMDDATIAGSVGSFHYRSEGADGTVEARVSDASVSATTKGSKVLEALFKYRDFSSPSDFLKYLASSDMAIEDSVRCEVGSASGVSPATINGARGTVTYSVEGLSFESATDTSKGSKVSTAIGSLDCKVEGPGLLSQISASGYSDSLSVEGKSPLTMLNLVPASGSPKDVDARAAALEMMDGSKVSGDIRVSALRVFNSAGAEGVDLQETEISVSGSDRARNADAKVDFSVSADKATGDVRVTGDYELGFTPSAVVAYRHFQSDGTGFSGEEARLEKIDLGVEQLVIAGNIDDFRSQTADASTLAVDVSADVGLRRWASDGASAYGEDLEMGSAKFSTTLSSLPPVFAGDIPAATGDRMVLTTYKVSDRGDSSYAKFDDVVAKADSTSVLKSTSFEYKPGEGWPSLSVHDAETQIEGKDSKITAASSDKPVAYLARNSAGFYDVVPDSDVKDDIPVYNLGSKPSDAGSDNTMLYVAIAIVAILAVAAVAYLLMRKRGSKA